MGNSKCLVQPKTKELQLKCDSISSQILAISILKKIFSITKIFQISTFKIYHQPHSLFFPYSTPAFLGFTTYIFIFLHLHACQYDPRRGSNKTNMVGFQYQIFLPLTQPKNPNPLHHWQHCHHLIRHCHDS